MSLTKKMLGSIALVSLTMASAMASGVGNGGVSVVCRDVKERITSAELLDIYEGKVRYGKRYDNELDPETKVELAQLRLAKYPVFLASFQEELAKVRAILLYIPVGNVLTPTDDAFPTILKKGCKFEQVANYTEDGDLLVSQEIHNEFQNVDRAALLVHETVYAMFRSAGAKDSRQARKLTAELLSQNPDLKVIEQILENNGGSSVGTCGLKGSVEQRIKQCNKQNGNFALVARTREGHEVYKDLGSGLIWGDRLASTMDHYSAEKACKADLKEVAGISSVTWRLPTVGESKEAEKNGFRLALPNMEYWFWSSSVHMNFPNSVWIFYGGDNYYNNHLYRYNIYSVRCVAR